MHASPPRGLPHAASTPASAGRDARTHAERLRQEIADAIADGRLEPGAALDEASLANRYGVSRTPVREALRQLVAAGLVVHRPHRGAEVARVSEARLDEMVVVLAELEAVAAGHAALNASPAERLELEQLHEHAAPLVQKGDRVGYGEVNDALHAAIHKASHNDFLVETLLTVRARVHAFSRARFASLGRLAASHHEHAFIVEAILRADRDAAARHMRDHLLAVRPARPEA